MNKLVIGIFLGFIGLIGLFIILETDRNFSEQENRVLSQMPVFSWKSFLSGDFTNDFEVYLSDQFIWKEFWTGLKADANQALLKQENNGVLFGRDGYLFERFVEPGEQLQRNLESLRSFSKNRVGTTVYLLLAPTSIAIYEDMLPMYAETYSQKETLEHIEKELADTLVYLDVYESLIRKKDELIYFRTDHHWTMRGAFYAYETVAKALGVTPFRSEDFHHTIVSGNFYGPYHSKAKPRRMTPDTIEIFEPKFEISYRVEYEGGQSVTDTLFESKFLNRKDQYALFLNGNHSLVKVTSSIQNGRKLAVMKDSYAHAFLPFLANHFEELHVIDLRYYRLSIDTYLSEHDISEVLFLYNIANFTNDPNLIWLQR